MSYVIEMNETMTTTIPEHHDISHLYVTPLYRVVTGLDTPDLIAVWGRADLYLYWDIERVISDGIHYNVDLTRLRHLLLVRLADSGHKFKTSLDKMWTPLLIMLDNLTDRMRTDLKSGVLRQSFPVIYPATPENRVYIYHDANQTLFYRNQELIIITPDTVLLNSPPLEKLPITGATTQEDVEGFIRSQFSSARTEQEVTSLVKNYPSLNRILNVREDRHSN